MPFGSSWWRKTWNRLLKCSERLTDSCDPIETDGCCGVIACRYCLQFDGYGGTVYATAEFLSDGWYGTINGWPFVAYWARNYDTGVCEFIVTLNGYEVYRKDCYEGQSCRDSSDSVEVDVSGEAGLLRWTKRMLRPLAHIQEEGCETWFCGSCECSCECLCVTVDSVEFGVFRGEICDTSYPCDPPVWAGTVGGFDLSIALGRDSYGNCIAQLTFDGEVTEWISAGGCSSMDITFTLYDGSTVHAVCKICDCETDEGCGGCCWATDSEDPTLAIPVQFDIIAPFCTELDSTSQGIYTFTPQESLGNVPNGSCGPCTWMLCTQAPAGGGPISVGGYQDDDPLPSPCGWHLAAALVCLAPDAGDSPTETTEPCCANVRLLMAADNEFGGSRVLTDFTSLAEFSAYSVAAQALIDAGMNWGKLKAPVNCSCDEVTGMHGEFDIGEWVSPACSGNPPFSWECCAPTECNLSGAVLQF